MVTTTLSKVPKLGGAVKQLNDSTWPEFLLYGDVRGWSSLYTVFAEFQVVFAEDERLIAAGLTVPCCWDPSLPVPQTIDEVVWEARWPLTTARGVLCAMAALVAPDCRGRGLSRQLVKSMVELARRHGLMGVLVPVRPIHKHKFPNEQMEAYCARRNAEGSTYDPWLRVHEQLGGTYLGIGEATLTVRGTIAEWQEWTGQKFNRSGEYVVVEALTPVVIDIEAGIGTYREPNVWYFHSAVEPNLTRTRDSLRA